MISQGPGVGRLPLDRRARQRMAPGPDGHPASERCRSGVCSHVGDNADTDRCELHRYDSYSDGQGSCQGQPGWIDHLPDRRRAPGSRHPTEDRHRHHRSYAGQRRVPAASPHIQVEVIIGGNGLSSTTSRTRPATGSTPTDHARILTDDGSATGPTTSPRGRAGVPARRPEPAAARRRRLRRSGRDGQGSAVARSADARH